MTETVGRSLGERIRSELETRIVSCEWPPGHRIRSEHKVERLGKASADALELRAGAKAVRVRCLHRMNGVPNAYEDRVILLSAVPGAERENFERIPPGTWLLQSVPWTEAQHVIHAMKVRGSPVRRSSCWNGALGCKGSS